MSAKPDYRVPLLIPFRDRAIYLDRLLEWARPSTLIGPITVFDMESTYPLAKAYLLERQQLCQIKLVECPNVGARGLFASGLVARVVPPNQRFLLSDPDVVPDCNPDQMVMAMHHYLDTYPRLAKVGCSLVIKDIPEHYPQRKKVVAWESRFWQKGFDFDAFDADVATTMCMIRRPDAVDRTGNGRAVRLKPPYVARHLPWYEDPDDLTPDVKHYYENAPMRRWGETTPGVSWSPLKDPNR